MESIVLSARNTVLALKLIPLVFYASLERQFLRLRAYESDTRLVVGAHLCFQPPDIVLSRTSNINFLNYIYQIRSKSVKDLYNLTAKPWLPTFLALIEPVLPYNADQGAGSQSH